MALWSYLEHIIGLHHNQKEVRLEKNSNYWTWQNYSQLKLNINAKEDDYG